MNPLYFPFTYVSESAGKALSACFRRITVYQISGTKIPEYMQELSRNGILDIRIPVEVNGEFLDKVLKDYRAWINTHQGTETAFIAAMADKIPYFDESYSSQLRAELKNIGKQSQPGEKPDPLFNAKLFLHMAQEFDFQMEALDQDMMDIEAMEDDFMRNLKWEDDNDHARDVARRDLKKEDLGQYMTAKRINAWASLMLQDTQIPGLLITTSQAVLDHLLEIMPEMEQVIFLDAIPLGAKENEMLSKWQDSLMEALEKLAIENRPVPIDNPESPPEISEKEGGIKLTIYRVPNKTPYECFSGLVGTDGIKVGPAKTDARFKNTFIGLVEKSG